MKCLFKSFARFSLGLLVLLLLNLMGAFETQNMPSQVRWLQRQREAVFRNTGFSRPSERGPREGGQAWGAIVTRESAADWEAGPGP